MNDFLQTSNKLSDKKRREINKSKRKTSLGKASSKKAIISRFNSLDEKELPISIPKTTKVKSEAKEIDITNIAAGPNNAACCLKRASVFTISMTDIEYQVENKVREKTNSKYVVSQEYQDFLDVFSKKTQTLSSYIENMIIRVS